MFENTLASEGFPSFLGLLPSFDREEDEVEGAGGLEEPVLDLLLLLSSFSDPERESEELLSSSRPFFDSSLFTSRLLLTIDQINDCHSRQTEQRWKYGAIKKLRSQRL